ncbi:MAG: Ig-like domain-containing protein [Chloroflexota bacterium]|nr:Ig-like domain-containing protein [Chloroflexota bacterium]
MLATIWGDPSSPKANTRSSVNSGPDPAKAFNSSGPARLDALIDANGNRTSWERDLQGRVTREVRADGVTDTFYTYGPRSGRLLTVTDPKDQVTTYTYALDNQQLSLAFTNAQIPTPGVSFTYDSQYPRVATMTDGTGLTTYAYHPAGQLGAGQVASVDGPLIAGTSIVPPSGSNLHPTVTLTAPANGTVATAPATITLTASATDPDGTVARVDFYAGATLLGSDATAPYPTPGAARRPARTT